MTKIDFKNLPDTSTPLSASNLNTMQDNIETAIDNTISNTSGTSQTIGYSQEYINNLNKYSTSEEIPVGTYIDNKPIYRKVFTGTTASGDTAINMSSLNISKIVSISGIVGQNNDYKCIPFILENYFISVRYFSGDMYITASSVYANLPFTLYVEYTKATD